MRRRGPRSQSLPELGAKGTASEEHRRRQSPLSGERPIKAREYGDPLSWQSVLASSPLSSAEKTKFALSRIPPAIVDEHGVGGTPDRAGSHSGRGMVDRLIAKLDRRERALKMCGIEIVELRKRNKELVDERDELRTQLLQRETTVDAAANAHVTEESLKQISTMSASEMRRFCGLVARKYEESSRKVDQLNEKVRALRELLARRKEREVELHNLQQAHMAQAVQVQRLQESTAELHRAQKLIHLQQRTIEKLEAVMETRAMNWAAEGAQNQGRRRAELVHYPKGAGDRPQDYQARGDPGEVATLQRQLAENAKAFGQELSRLKIQLMQLQSQNS